LRILHYALNPGGHLMLGTSESVGDAPDLFSLLDRKSKIYAKKNVPLPVGTESAFGTPYAGGETHQQPFVAPKPTLGLHGLVDRRCSSSTVHPAWSSTRIWTSSSSADTRGPSWTPRRGRRR